MKLKLAIFSLVATTALLCLVLATRALTFWVPGEAVWDYEATLRPFLLLPIFVVLIAALALAFRRLNRETCASGAWFVAGCCALSLFLMLGLSHLKNGGLNRLALLTINPAAGGYFEVAYDWRDRNDWLANYSREMKDRQHVETHPPGALVLSQWWLRQTKNADFWSAATDEILVMTEQTALATLAQTAGGIWKRPYAPADVAAAFWLALTLMIAGASLPAATYVMAKSALDSEAKNTDKAALISALLTALLPATALFAPALDLACAALAAWAMVLALWGAKRNLWWLQLGAGAVLCLGILCSFSLAGIGAVILVMLPLQLAGTSDKWRRVALHGAIFVASALAFALILQALGVRWLEIWSSVRLNQAAEMAGVGRTYLKWVGLNPLDFALFLGLPVALTTVYTLFTIRRDNAENFALRTLLLPTLAALCLLNLAGITLAEVGRIWLPFMPPLVAATGVWLAHADRKLLWTTLICQGVTLLALGFFLNVWAL